MTIQHQVKARGTRIPEVWYRSPYCTPEAEVARGHEDSWSGENDGVKEDGEEMNKSRVWVSVEPSVDSWALGILTYAMLTGSHPWTETACDCSSYQKYVKWCGSSKGHNDELGGSKQGVIDFTGAEFGNTGCAAMAPQFAFFTPLACSFFLSLLDPRPRLRGRPEDGLSYLGGDWVMEKERMRLEEERKKSRGKGAIGNVKKMEGGEP